MKNTTVIFLIALASCNFFSGKKYSDWKVYGGNKENNHYSSLDQVDTGNVTLLKPAWEYHTGDADSMTQIQVNPDRDQWRAVWRFTEVETICTGCFNRKTKMGFRSGK